jgi:hypothetical protein
VQSVESRKPLQIAAERSILQLGASEWMAGGGGFEPPLTGPEPVVLPLDDPPAYVERFHYNR